MRRNDGAHASILEFGGANSCFIDQILEEVAPARYDVIDSNQLGLDLLQVPLFPRRSGLGQPG